MVDVPPHFDYVRVGYTLPTDVNTLIPVQGWQPQTGNGYMVESIPSSAEVEMIVEGLVDADGNSTVAGDPPTFIEGFRWKRLDTDEIFQPSNYTDGGGTNNIPVDLSVFPHGTEIQGIYRVTSPNNTGTNWNEQETMPFVVNAEYKLLYRDVVDWGGSYDFDDDVVAGTTVTIPSVSPVEGTPSSNAGQQNQLLYSFTAGDVFAGWHPMVDNVYTGETLLPGDTWQMPHGTVDMYPTWEVPALSTFNIFSDLHGGGLSGNHVADVTISDDPTSPTVSYTFDHTVAQGTTGVDNLVIDNPAGVWETGGKILGTITLTPGDWYMNMPAGQGRIKLLTPPDGVSEQGSYTNIVDGRYGPDKGKFTVNADGTISNIAHDLDDDGVYSDTDADDSNDLIGEDTEGLNLGYWTNNVSKWTVFDVGTTLGGSDVFSLDPDVHSSLTYGSAGEGNCQIPLDVAQTYYVTVVGSSNGIKKVYTYEGLVSDALALNGGAGSWGTEVPSNDPNNPQWGMHTGGTHRFTIVVDGLGNYTVTPSELD